MMSDVYEWEFPNHQKIKARNSAPWRFCGGSVAVECCRWKVSVLFKKSSQLLFRPKLPILKNKIQTLFFGSI